MRLTAKLLSYLHRVFDKDPGPFLALRLRYDGGMTWRVQDGVLTTTVAGGSGEGHVVPLDGLSVADLATFFAAKPGYSVPYVDGSQLSRLSALALIDASGDINTSNGDHLYGYTSVLWSKLEAFAVELTRAREQIVQMLRQMSTTTADGEWLDEIGGYYAVPRLAGESDQSYGPRIIAEVLRPRANNVAMEEAIKVFTGQDARVTDVTLYGPTFPLYNGNITRNSVYTHSASAIPVYGLFDVEYRYDLVNGGDIEQFAETVRGVIDRLRDAGTHLRSLLLMGSDIGDAFPLPSDGAASQDLAVVQALADLFAEPNDDAIAVSGGLQGLSDAMDAALEDTALSVGYAYRYSGLRRYNGAIMRMGVQVAVETV